MTIRRKRYYDYDELIFERNFIWQLKKDNRSSMGGLNYYNCCNVDVSINVKKH